MADPDFALAPVEGTPQSVLPEATTPDSESLFEAAMKAVGEPSADAAETTAPVSAVADSAAPEAAAAPAEPEKPAERIAPALLKIMERESAIVERESALKSAEGDLVSLRDRLDAYETAQKKFRYDPVAFVRQMAPDVDLADLAKQLWYEKLGNGAPAEYRATKEARAARSTVDELRAEMEQKLQAERTRWSEEQQQREAEAAYHQYVGALGAIAKQVPDEYPLVKSFASNSPERVQQALFKIAQKHAQATNGEVLTPAECAAKLNTELDGLRSVLGGAPPAASTPAPKAPAPPVSTLRNKHTSIQPNRAMPDPSDEEAKFQAALDAVRGIQ